MPMIGNQGGISAAPILQAIAQQRANELAMRQLALQSEQQDYGQTQNFIHAGQAQIKAGGDALKGKRDFAAELARQREAQTLDTQYKQAQMQQHRDDQATAAKQNQAELDARTAYQDKSLAEHGRIADQTDARQREINAENVKSREQVAQQHAQGQIEAQKNVHRHQIETEYAHKIANAKDSPAAVDAFVAERVARLAALDATSDGQQQNSPTQAAPSAPHYVPEDQATVPMTPGANPNAYAGAPRENAPPRQAVPQFHSPFDTGVVPGDAPFGRAEPLPQAPEQLDDTQGAAGETPLTAEQINSRDRAEKEAQKIEQHKYERQTMDDTHQSLVDQRRESMDAKRQAADEKKNAPKKAADRFVDNEVGTATDPTESLHRMSTALARFDGRAPSDWKNNPMLAAEVNRVGLAKLAEMQAADKNTAALTPEMKDAIAVTEWERQNAHHKNDKDLSATEIREAIKRRMAQHAPQTEAPQAAPVQTAPSKPVRSVVNKAQMPEPKKGFVWSQDSNGDPVQVRDTRSESEQNNAAIRARPENQQKVAPKPVQQAKPIPTPKPVAAEVPGASMTDEDVKAFAQGVEPKKGVATTQPVRVKTVAEANALKPGTMYYTPSGTLKKR